MSRIIVKNLPHSGVDVNDLKNHFSDIDNVTDVKLNYKDTGAFRRFAFVGFKNQDGAEKAIEKLNNSFIKNSRINLELCRAIKETKPEKIGYNKMKMIENTQDEEDVENNSDNKKKKSKKNKKDSAVDVFDDVKDEVEFKEFLSLQRNLGENSKSKQIWADDVTMETELIDSSKNVKESENDIDNDGVKKNRHPDLSDDGTLKPRKKHKRSRGKKKSAKTKPKELFVHTVKISGFTDKVRRKDIKDFFKPLEVISIRNNKRDGICFVSFKDERDLKFAMRKNLQFWETSRIRIWRHNVERSRVFKERVREKVKEKEETFKKYEASLAETESIEESGRLFVRNLNYTCTQENLEEVFTKYGELTEVHFPIDKKTSLPKGYAYVEFMFPKNAIKAYEELNGTIFQGRNFHLIPSKPKPETSNRFFMSSNNNSNNNNQIDNKHSANDNNTSTNNIKLEPNSSNETDTTKQQQQQNLLLDNKSLSTFKKEKLHQQKEFGVSRSGAPNWNILFLGQNALADVVSDLKGMEKSKMLTHQTQKEPIAVRMALGDAMVVEEMRKFLISNGIELDSFDNPQTKRSNTVIIAKNLPSMTSRDELQKLFENFGRVSRVIIPPNGLTAIIEMEEPVEAKGAFKKLSYSKFKDSILYLEWAPINVFKEKSLDDQEKSDFKQLEKLQTGSKILVKNIPFEATVQELRKIFASYGELNFVRIPKKVDGQHRGFGFVDYLTKEDALRAFKTLCHSTHLYGRKLILEWAKTTDSQQQP